jgi:hypothetical protein
VRRVFFDCEFVEDGRTIELISIGCVDEDGREFYAVSSQFDPMSAGPWVQKHVLPQLPRRADPAWKSRETIRADLYDWLTDGLGSASLQLWAWLAAYDHVVLAQLWGAMPALPRDVPRFTHDLRSLWELVGSPPLPQQQGGHHDALGDARHNLVRWRAMEPALKARDLL